MNKKISARGGSASGGKIETAIGIILAVALIAGGLVWLINKQQNKPTESLQATTKNTAAPAPVESKTDNFKILFATNGDRDIYKIKKGDQWVVVVDGQESEVYDSVATPAFSLDGTQFAYSASLKGQIFLVINGVAQPTSYQSINEIVFSPDGKKIAYVANKNEKYVIVVNEKEGKAYQEIGKLETNTGETYIVFSSDSQNVAYKVIADQGAFIVVNNKEGKIYSDVSNFVFSDDGKQYAYQAQQGSQDIVVVNQKEIVNNPSGSAGSQTAGASADSSSSDYSKFFKNGTKDVNLDPNRLNYPVCNNGSTGKNCNF